MQQWLWKHMWGCAVKLCGNHEAVLVLVVESKSWVEMEIGNWRVKSREWICELHSQWSGSRNSTSVRRFPGMLPTSCRCDAMQCAAEHSGVSNEIYPNQTSPNNTISNWLCKFHFVFRLQVPATVRVEFCLYWYGSNVAVI